MKPVILDFGTACMLFLLPCSWSSSKAKLDLARWDETFEVKWIPIEKAGWDKAGSITGGNRAEITSVHPGDAFAVLTIAR